MELVLKEWRLLNFVGSIHQQTNYFTYVFSCFFCFQFAALPSSIFPKNTWDVLWTFLTTECKYLPDSIDIWKHLMYDDIFRTPGLYSLLCRWGCHTKVQLGYVLRLNIHTEIEFLSYSQKSWCFSKLIMYNKQVCCLQELEVVCVVQWKCLQVPQVNCAIHIFNVLVICLLSLWVIQRASKACLEVNSSCILEVFWGVERQILGRLGEVTDSTMKSRPTSLSYCTVVFGGGWSELTPLSFQCGGMWEGSLTILACSNSLTGHQYSAISVSAGVLFQNFPYGYGSTM